MVASLVYQQSAQKQVTGRGVLLTVEAGALILKLALIWQRTGQIVNKRKWPAPLLSLWKLRPGRPGLGGFFWTLWR